MFAVIYALKGKVVGRGSEEMSLEEAVNAAERAIESGIHWTNHRLGSLDGGRSYLIKNNS